MKKLFWILACGALCLSGCNSQENKESDDNMTDVYIPIGPHIRLDKEEYSLTDSIDVKVYNASETDWVGFYYEFEEPSIINSTSWQYVSNKQTLTFMASSLKEAGEYSIYLCKDGGYEILDVKKIYIKSSDTNDYKIDDASFTSTLDNKVLKSSISIKPSVEKQLTYLLYWTKDKKRLSDYTYIKKVTHKGMNEFTIDFNDCMYMPQEANGIEITTKEGKTTSYFLDINEDTLKLKKSKHLFDFEVLTDIHISTVSDKPAHIIHLKSALKNILDLHPNSKGVVTIGDHTNYGKRENYELLMSTISSVFDEKSPNIYFSLGNHEYIYKDIMGGYPTAVSLFKEYTKQENIYYSFEIDGLKFIILGSDSGIGEGTIGETQFNWLKQQLQSTDKTKPTFLFVHQPLIDTVSGSLYSKNSSIQYWYGIDSGVKIKEMLKDYPNATLFSGHTHWTLDSVQPILFGNGESANYINCASVGYLWNDSNTTEAGSEGVFVEVYEDYILLRGREFVEQKWVATAQFVFPTYK